VEQKIINKNSKNKMILESNDSFIHELYIENLGEEKLLEKYKNEKFLKNINSG